MKKYSFTSESVTEGHPDKMADQISDAVLDAILAEDAGGRVACETLLTTGLCVVAVKTIKRVVITDALDYFAGNFWNINVGTCRNLSGNHA